MGYYVNQQYQDTTFQAHDITWLFRLAQEWMMANPADLIPLEVWEQKAAELPVPDDQTPLAIFVAGIGVHSITPDIIPALAAISLRKAPEVVAGHLEHHGADYQQMIHIAYEHADVTQEQRKSCQAEDVKNQVLDDYPVARAVIQAMASNPRQRAVLLDQAMAFPGTMAVAFAKLGDETPEMWPITYLERAFEESGYVAPSHLPRSVSVDYEYTWDAIRYVNLPDEFSQEDFINLLDRSGALHLGACRHRGFSDNVFKRVLTDVTSDLTAYNTQRFLDAINTEDRPEVIERISRKMLAVLKDYSTDGLGWTSKVNDAMDERYDKTRYGHVTNSLAVKLCLQDIGPLSIDELLEIAEDPDAVFPRTEIKMSQLLVEAATDFLSKPTDQLEYDDFRIVHRVLVIGAKQEFDDGIINQLIARMLDGMESLHHRYKDQEPGYRTASEQTTRVVEESVQYLLKWVAPDFELFNTLSSGSQSILAASGLDITNFPNMTRADRGRVLESDLGM